MSEINENPEVLEQGTEIDAEWEEDESPAQNGTEENAGNPAAEPPAADQQQGTAQEPGQQANPPAAPELFTLKNRDETRQVTRDELIAMAQKGWDYDTVRTERDQLRQYRSEADPALELVKGYAEKNGMSVPEYLDFCRKQELMRGGLDEKAADQTIQMEKRQAALDAQEARINADKAQQDTLLNRVKEQQEARRKDMDAFLKAYPTVKAQDIPKEVWGQVAKGVPLVSAYAMHENQQLKAELAAERQNKVNQAKSPGSLGSNTGPELDEIDRFWAEDD